MKAITLWQPWASLIFTGDKRHETRAFDLPDKVIGEWVAIHAALRPIRPSELTVGLDLLCRQNWGPNYADVLPYGAVLGTVKFGQPLVASAVAPDSVDRLCGDFGLGRSAWPVLDRKQLPEPMPWRGRQGWFEVDL